MPEKDLYARSGTHSPGLLQKFYQWLWRTEQILVRPAAELPQVLISFVKRDHEGAERLRKSLEGTWLNLPDAYHQRYAPILERTPKLIVVLLCRRNNCGCLGHHHPPGTESKLTHMQRDLNGIHAGELDLAFEAIREWIPLPLSHLALSLEDAEDEFTSFQLQLGLLAVFLEKLHQLVSPGEPEEAVRGQCQAFYSEVLSHFVAQHYRVEYGLRCKPSKITS